MIAVLVTVLLGQMSNPRWMSKLEALTSWEEPPTSIAA